MTSQEKKTREQLHGDEINFFAGYYEGHRQNPAGRCLRLRRELRSLLRRSVSGRLGKVLSLCCGDGQFELMMAPHATRVVGLDISPESIAAAKRAAKVSGVLNVEFRCLPLEHLEWSEIYDTVVILQALHHVPPSDVSELLRCIHDHLTPGGLFYSQEPNRKGVLRTVGRVVLGQHYGHYHTPDELELDPAELAGCLKHVGFKNIHVGSIDLTLNPGLFILAKWPALLMYPMLWADWLWCHSPLAPWGSGFYVSANRG